MLTTFFTNYLLKFVTRLSTMGKRSKNSNKEDIDIEIKETKSKKKETKSRILEKNEDTERITVSEDNETPKIINEDKCITKKKSKSKHNKSLTNDNTSNKKTLFDDNAEERITVTESNKNQTMSENEDKRITKKKSKSKHNKSLNNDSTPNKKIIFDDNAEALEVPIKMKKENKKQLEPKEDEPTEEEIDQFCDEINEEDNVEYENWVQLIEAKLNSNKKKT